MLKHTDETVTSQITFKTIFKKLQL